MGEIVIVIVDVADSDAPPPIAVPANQFNIAVAGAQYGRSVVGENIRSFMDAQTSPAAAVSPGIVIRVIILKRDREAAFFQMERLVSSVDFRDVRDHIHRGRMFVIVPDPFADLFFFQTFLRQKGSDGVENIKVILWICLAVTVGILSDSLKKGNRFRHPVIRVRIDPACPQGGGNLN